MSDVPAINGGKPEAKKRGPYSISPKLQRALMLLASGEAKTQVEACAQAQLSVRALQKALRRESVRQWMRQTIMSELGLSAMRAARALDQILTSGNNEMARVAAAKFSLGAGFGIAPPSTAPSVQVNVGPVGYCLDLRQGADNTAPLSPADAAAVAAAREGNLPGYVLMGSLGVDTVTEH